jgi:type I restriction enzyme, S subunit
MTAQPTFGDFVESYRNGFGIRPNGIEHGPVVLRIADVSTGEISLRDPRRGSIPEKAAETYQLVPGDLVMIRVNGAREIVGRCCVVRDDLPPDVIFNDHLIRVRLKSGLDPSFARFLLSAPRARKIIEEAASTSAGQLTINQQVISGLPVPVVDEGVQRLIAKSITDQLAEVETARAAVTAQLRDVQALTDAIYKETFCHITPTSGPTPLNALPEGWVWQRLEEIAQINPRRPAIDRADDAATSFVPMEAVDEYSGTIAIENVRKFQKVSRGYTYFENGDVIFAKITPCMQNGKHAIVADLIDGIGFGSTEFHVIRALDGIVPAWIHLFLRWNATLAEAKRSFTGAVGQQRVPTSFLENLQIPIPRPNQRVELADLANKKLEEVEALRLITLARLAEINLLPQKILSAAFEM